MIEVRNPENDYWTCRHRNYSQACILYHPNNPCPDAGGYHPAKEQQAYWCGWPTDYQNYQGCGCTPAYRYEQREYDLAEAMVSGSVSCAVAGSGGWCRDGAELSLSGSEPLAGYTILALEGTRNGETFACPGSSCSVPLVEGVNDFTFWALSSWGDSSRMGTASGRLDSGPPVISGQMTGTAGEAGWHISEVTVTASAGDAVSGVVSFDLALDGGGWAPYGGPITLSDGEHTIELRASDAAGNVATESLEVRVDAQPPDLNLAVGGSFCPGCGESVDIALDVQDGRSGVAEWSLTAEGNAIASGTGPASETFAWDGSGLSARTHTLTLSTHDAAGNAADMSVSVQLVAPTAVPPTEQSSNPAPQGMVVVSGPTATWAPIPTSTPLPTRTPSASSFGGLPAVPLGIEEAPPDESEPGLETEPVPSPPGSTSGVLWGGAAAMLVAAATAAALEAARRRKEEEARLKEEMRRRNATAEAREAEVKRLAGLARLAVLAAAAAEAARRGWERVFNPEEERLERTWQEEEERGHESLRSYPPPAAVIPPSFDVGEWKRQEYTSLSNAHRGEDDSTARGMPSPTPEPDVFLMATDELIVWSDPVVLIGGPGTSPTYAQVAEESYRGHSGGGPPDPRVAVPGLFIQLLTWVRDATPLMDWMMDRGWIVPDARAGVSYRHTDIPPFIMPDLTHLDLPNVRWDLIGSTPPPPGTILDPGGRGLTITAVQVANSGNQVLHIRDVWIHV
ncbi:MAG: hypothetical protein AB1449_12040, partial [Chloroflexota bacterium]